MKLDSRSIRTLLCAGLAAGLAAVGCSNEDTTRPAETGAPEFGIPAPPGQDSSSLGLRGWGGFNLLQLLGDINDFATGELLPDALETLSIDSSGGTLSVDRYTLLVPPGAVTEPTEFELRYFEDGLTMFELLPHGVEFEVPVTIMVDLSGTNLAHASNVTLYWYDESAEDWVDVGGLWLRRSSVLVGTTTHFSKWGTGRAGW